MFCRNQQASTLTKFFTFAQTRIGLWLAAMCVVVGVIGLYFPLMSKGLEEGDRRFIHDHLYVQNLETLHQLVHAPKEALEIRDVVPYRPVLSLSLVVDNAVEAGRQAWPFRCSQIVLTLALGFGLSAWALFIIKRISDHWSNYYVALLVGLLFCVHVKNVQLFADLSSRATLLGLGGMVGSLLLYAYLPLWRQAHVYLIPMVIGALADPMAVLFAPLLLGYGLLFEKRLGCREIFSAQAWPKVRHAFGKSLPAFVTGMGLLMFLDSVETQPHAEGRMGSHSWLIHHALNGWATLGAYLFPGILPAPEKNSLPWLNMEPWGGLIGLLCVGWLMWVTSGIKELRPVSFGLFWFLLGVLNMDAGKDSWTSMSSAFLYASTGLTLAVGGLATYSCQHYRRRVTPSFMVKTGVARFALAFFVVFQLVGTFHLRDWQGDPRSIPIPKKENHEQVQSVNIVLQSPPTK